MAAIETKRSNRLAARQTKLQFNDEGNEMR